MDFLLLIYGTTVPTEMKRQRNRGVLGVERKLTINKEKHGRVYTKPWFSFISFLRKTGNRDYRRICDFGNNMRFH